MPFNAQSWAIQELQPMPEGVSNNAVTEGWLNDTAFIYSFGGIDSSKAHSGIHLKSFRYNTVTGQWKNLTGLPDTMGKIAAAASRVGNIIYIIGGYHVFPNGSEKSSNKIHRYDIADDSFLTDGPPIPVPIDDHVQAVWKDSLIFVITGWSNNANVGNVQIYNTTLNTWAAGTSLPNNSNYLSFGASGAISGDTIVYFGGARFGGNFPIQNNVRTGIINPQNPSQINWSDTILDFSLVTYRSSSFLSFNQIHWIGGSSRTYNFDGIAYNGSGGVAPNGLNFYYDPIHKTWTQENIPGIPMDLRGQAKVSDTVVYLAGGMEDNQKVSRKLLKLTRIELPSGHPPTINRLSLNIHPNPGKDYIEFDMPASLKKNYSLRIIDSAGNEMIYKSMYISNTRLSTATLRNGMYFIKIKDSNSIYTDSFIINR